MQMLSLEIIPLNQLQVNEDLKVLNLFQKDFIRSMEYILPII